MPVAAYRFPRMRGVTSRRREGGEGWGGDRHIRVRISRIKANDDEERGGISMVENVSLSPHSLFSLFFSGPFIPPPFFLYRSNLFSFPKFPVPGLF